MSQPRAPIAFFAYKRPQHTLQSLSSLSRCSGSEESELFIFCDGPRSDEDVAGVEEVRRIAKSRSWCGATHVIEGARNQGLAQAIINGVTKLVNDYGKIIVIEDDLIFSAQYLEYMNWALEVYRDDPKAMQVCGYMFPLKNSSSLPDTFFLPWVSSWGWGTWENAWRNFNPDSKELYAQLCQRKLIEDFNLGGFERFDRMLLDHIEGRNNSWAIRWYASVLLAGGLCLYPRRSLLRNIGFDGTGEHCGHAIGFETVLTDDQLALCKQDIASHIDALTKIQEFYYQRNRLFAKVSRRIKMLLPRKNDWRNNAVTPR